MASAREPIDRQTADRLLSGWVAPDDAPPGYRRLADALARMRNRDEPTDDAALVRAMADVITEGHLVPRRKSVLRRLPAKAVLVSCALFVTATGAAAATGGLPDAAQDGLANAASHIGVNLPTSASDRAREVSAEPGPPEGTATSTTTTEASTTTTATSSTTSTTPSSVPSSTPDSEGPPATNHGAVVSETARNADPEGGKGEEVAPVARDNHGREVSEANTPNSKANANGGATNDNGGPPASVPGNGRGRR